MYFNSYFSAKYIILKVSNEFKIGLSVVLATVLLIFGINYLKGNSFFGGDDVYYAFFPSSGTLSPSSSVTLNGVVIGNVISVDLVDPNKFIDPNKRVLIKFSIQKDGMKIARGSHITIVPGILNTEVQLQQNYIAEHGYLNIGDTIYGSVSQELTEQLETQLLPVKRKLEDLMTSIDNIVTSITVFWDTSAANTLNQGLNEVKIAIARFGNVAYNLDDLITSEKAKLGRIFDNVEDITYNFKETNASLKRTIGNAEAITDSLMTSDLKGVISSATETLQRLNLALKDASEGNGTLGKLLKDEQLYNELNSTAQRLQDLVDDIKVHPERYIHFSVFGTKSKGVPLTKDEEKKLRDLLNATPNKQ